MSTELEYHPGSAMALLSPERQTFVEAMVRGGAGPTMVAKAAAEAGYSEGYGWRLMKEPRVLAALREEAAKGLLGGALLGQKVLSEIAMDSTHKDRFRAAVQLLAHSGFTITQEQKITVEHVNSEAREMIKEIRDFAAATGLDAKQLLAAIGVSTPALPAPDAIDAEFEEIDEEVWSA